MVFSFEGPLVKHLSGVAGDDVAKVLQEFYAGACGEHQGGFRLLK